MAAAWLFGLAGAPAAAQPVGLDDEVAGDVTTTRPDPEGQATPVSIGLYVLDVQDIDAAAQNFTADVYITLSWRDERLRLPTPSSAQAHRVVRISDIWEPGLTLINRTEVRVMSVDLARVYADGLVVVETRRQALLASPLDLRDFPFDRQELRIDVASTRYGPQELELVLDRERSGHMEDFSLAGWDVSTGEASTSDARLAGKRVARFTQRLTARRQSVFFVTKIIVPLSLIVFMAWAVFWIDPEDVGPQLGVATASVLTLIAFQFSLVGLLPEISYLTRIDQFVLGATLLVFLALGEALLTTRLGRRGRRELAAKLDSRLRWVYALLFVGVVLWCFKY